MLDHKPATTHIQSADAFSNAFPQEKTRIEAARKLLERTDHSVMDIMLEAGYNDLKAFRQIFRKYTGMTPTAYRKKFYRKKEVTLTASEK